MNSTVIERIKKLLSLAQSDNANERDAALAKAQRIATENAVDLALLDLSDVGVVKEEEMIEDKVSLGRQLSAHKRFVTSIVTEVCGVEIVYWVRGWNEKSVSYLGPKSAVEFAKWLHGFLLDEYVRRWNYERKAHDLPATHRNTFYLGIRDGQRQRIRDEKLRAEREAIQSRAVEAVSAAGAVEGVAEAVETKKQEYTGKYQVACVSEVARRKDFLKKTHPKLGTLRSNRVSIRSHDTYASGTSHGRAIGLNRPLKG